MYMYIYIRESAQEEAVSEMSQVSICGFRSPWLWQCLLGQ